MVSDTQEVAQLQTTPCERCDTPACGDLAAGYRLHDREAVHLFCVETIAAQTVTAEAVCVLEA